MKKERLVAFTDAVLAIIMTILVLDLDKPDPITLQGFWKLRWSFAAYAVSFFWLGSLWVGLNGIWDKAEHISNTVVWWTLLLLFFASFIPYATSLLGDGFTSRLVQSLYGIVVIIMTAVNYYLHVVLDEPNRDHPELLKATADYRKMLMPDILIKCAGLIICLLFYPPAMILSVLIAAIYIFTARARKK
jgi:uncharacterized membrane protein